MGSQVKVTQGQTWKSCELWSRRFTRGSWTRTQVGDRLELP